MPIRQRSQRHDGTTSARRHQRNLLKHQSAHEVEPDDAKADYRRRQADCQNVPDLVAGNALSRRSSALNDWGILRHAPSLSRGTHTTFFRSSGSENAQSPATSSFHLGEKCTGTPIVPRPNGGRGATDHSALFLRIKPARLLRSIFKSRRRRSYSGLVAWGSHQSLSGRSTATKSQSTIVIVMMPITIRLRAYRSGAQGHRNHGDQSQCCGAFHCMLLCASHRAHVFAHAP
jgi:hypothetical protein